MDFEYDNLESLGWDHIVISIAPAFSKIYINTEVVDTLLINMGIIDDKNIVVSGNMEDIMVFNKALHSVDGLYNTQLKK